MGIKNRVNQKFRLAIFMIVMLIHYFIIMSHFEDVLIFWLLLGFPAV